MATAEKGQLAERLLADNVITADQCEAALHRVRTSSARLEDALIDTGAVAEYDLLKYLAKLYRTRFVVTSKLARVDLDRSLLELVPRELAERLLVFPVLYDPGSSTLSVVSPDAGDAEVAQAVQAETQVSEVKVFVGRPTAVRAAIQKHYGGDIYAFAHADTTGREQYMSLLELYDRSSSRLEAPASVAPTAERPRERMLTEREIEARGSTAAAPTRASTALMDTTAVLVSLLENGRGDLRGHSSLVSKWMGRLAERIRLREPEAQALALAGLLHDVGKTATYHLTALNVAQFESHRQVALKSAQSPERLFEGVALDPSVMDSLRHMYERYDGGGFPDARAGKDIPLGARLLAIVDTYCDLTQNGRNPYRRALSPSEACDVLDRQRRAVFDPDLTDLMRQAVTGDDLRERLLAERATVVIIDADPEETAVLELRLLESGFDVRPARSVDEALGLLARGPVEACIAETDIAGVSGFDLLARAREGGGAGAEAPWVFLTRDARRESVTRGFELGASDYVLKPAPAEVLVAKVRQLLAARAARSPRGVSGSLAELGLTDVVQVLWQGRKTGQLRVRRGAEQGEVHFQDGAIVNALWPGLRGEEAFYALLALDDGEFAFDATQKPGARVITASVEGLMLEGLRRLDERTHARS